MDTSGSTDTLTEDTLALDADSDTPSCTTAPSGTNVLRFAGTAYPVSGLWAGCCGGLTWGVGGSFSGPSIWRDFVVLFAKKPVESRDYDLTEVSVWAIGFAQHYIYLRTLKTGDCRIHVDVVGDNVTVSFGDLPVTSGSMTYLVAASLTVSASGGDAGRFLTPDVDAGPVDPSCK